MLVREVGEEALFKTPLPRCHNRSAKKKLELEMSLQFNPKYKEYIKWRCKPSFY